MSRRVERFLLTTPKAIIVGARVQDPAGRPGGKTRRPRSRPPGARQPPYDPEALCLLVEHSNSLRLNVDACARSRRIWLSADPPLSRHCGQPTCAAQLPGAPISINFV